MAIKVLGASVQGRDHVLFGRNNQDSFEIVSEVEGRACGVVCDGCGEGKRSEVGSCLSAAYVARWLWQDGEGVGRLIDLPEIVIKRLIGFYRTLYRELYGLPEGAPLRADTVLPRFGFEHLLTTVLGFYIRGDEGIAFAVGDGTLVVGTSVTTLVAEGNAPKYPVYSVLSGAPPQITVLSFSTKDVDRVAVATDGFDPLFLNEAFTRNSSVQLTRWLRVAQKQHRAFSDDATIALATISEVT